MTADEPVNRAAVEPSITHFEATVCAIDGRDVSLDRTYFYAEGGGQPADRGTLGGAAVVDVQKRDGETVHTLADDPTFDVDETVSGRIDEDFRRYVMSAHTASHVVYGAGRRLFDDRGYGGFDIGEDRIRLDFRLPDAEPVDPVEIQRLANEAVWNRRAVEWYQMDTDEARADDDIVFNLGDDAVGEDSVRIVEIDGWDISACGGTHVRNTSEIGPIEILDVSNPGADLVRVEFAVGQAAIDHRVEEARTVRRTADVLDTGTDDLSQRAESLLSETESLRSAVTELRERLLDARLAELAADTYERNGREWLVGTVEGVGPNAVADRLREADAADVVVLVGSDGSTFVVVSTGGDVDANAVVEEITDDFGGGGGGQPTLAQGGGLDADPQSVVESLSER